MDDIYFGKINTIHVYVNFTIHVDKKLVRGESFWIQSLVHNFEPVVPISPFLLLKINRMYVRDWYNMLQSIERNSLNTATEIVQETIIYINALSL